ncbi:MAG: TatD family hydrolase, partial [Gammaproteobacteria bacterium]|nr:TatD family hydrolase [Gammaproteobacteria bacterium]MBS9782011.1 TatD family hydrolase [Gammaproteobacteria bacterium]
MSRKNLKFIDRLSVFIHKLSFAYIMASIVEYLTMLIDTHSHFDFPIFDDTRERDWQKAQSLGVSAQFMMSIAPSNFAKVEQLANRFNGTFFALGIHPMFIADLALNT